MILIETNQQLQDNLQNIANLKHFGLDIESTGLDPFVDKHLLTQIGNEDQQFIIDSRKVNVKPLKLILEDKNIPKYLANGSFDYKWIRNYGIKVSNLIDVLNAERILNAGKVNFKTRGRFSLEGIARLRLNRELNKDVRDSFPLHKRGAFSIEQLEYAVEDVIAPIQIFKQQRKELLKEGLMRTFNLETECVPIFGDIEYNGIYLDKGKWLNLYEENLKNLDKFKKKTKEIFRDVIDIDLLGEVGLNLESDQQLLYGIKKLGYDLSNTAEETLRQHLPKNIYDPIIKYREYGTACSRYGPSYTDEINPVTNRVHTNLFQIGTECIVGDSIIPTSDGLLEIKQLVGNNKWDKLQIKVASRSGVDVTSYSYNPGKRKVVSIKTVGGHTLSGTFEHPILVIRKKFYDCNMKILTKYSNKEWTHLSELKKGDYICVSKGNNVWGSHSMDLKLAKLLGMWFADGSIHDSSGSWKIRINNDSDKVHEFVKIAVKELFDLKARVSKPHCKTGKCSIEFGSVNIKWLQDIYGLRKGATNKRIPDLIKKGNIDVIKSFIEGAQLDTHYRKDRKRLIHSMCTYQVAKWFHCAYINLGHDAYLSHFYDKKYKKYYYKISIDAECKKEIVLRKIKSIDISDKEQNVFDLTVPKSHSFVANGIISHNTGRPASTKPNLLNIPQEEKYRSCFTAQNGGKILTNDYAGQEICLMTEITRDPVFLDALVNGDNVHKIIGSKLFSLVLNQEISVNKSNNTIEFQDTKIKMVDLYNTTKGLNFGIGYGMGPKRAMQLFLELGIDCDIELGKKVVNAHKSICPQLHSVMDGIRQEILEVGYAVTIGGRKRYFPYPKIDDMPGKDKKEKYKKFKGRLHGMQREGGNFPIQGSAADMLKRAMVILSDKMADLNKLNELRLTLNPYDELVCESEDNHEENHALIQASMIEAQEYYQQIVPAAVEGIIADHWSK